MDWEQLFWLILATPLASAALIALFFRRNGPVAAGISVLAAALIAVMSVHAALHFPLEEAPTFAGHQLLQLGGLTLSLGFDIDSFALVMLAVVGVVGFFIHLFSAGYMADDENRGRYFAGLSIFMFSMLGIVLADNLFMIFIFWELVGFSSYMLIAHYWTTDEASAASKKAFIVNRVGDFGMLLGIIWAWSHFGTVNLSGMAAALGEDAALLNSGIALLLMCGFIGKSAQFPLHVWLPDAMAGPTPVSALIHAATMVAAGIYFLCRIDFLMLGTDAQTVILWLGGAMTAYAGFCALAQSDIKRILAYSTLSQLGYMAVAFGLGYPGLALFHTATHAFFKALLFLGSGSVIHACHHEQDIFKMGGLYKRMPITTLTFAIGLLCLCGVYGTSGYFSKDAIIEAAYLQPDRTMFYLTFGSAALTALYMGRLFWIAFMGAPRSDHAKHAKESSLLMVVPLVCLAAGSLAVGYENLWPDTLLPMIEHSLHEVHAGIQEAGAKTMFLVAGTAAWVLGLSLSWAFYQKGKNDRLKQIAPAAYRFLEGRLWFDEIYNWYVSVIQQRAALVLYHLDNILVNGILVRMSAWFTAVLGIGARALHTGSLHAYVYWFAAGLIVFGAFAFGFL